MKTKKLQIPSVNFHLWEPCNMRCKFCFATFQDVKNSILPKGHLPKEDAIKVVRKIAEFGFEKITFVGGEPTLCPWLSDLITEAKKYGLTTMVVTNGSLPVIKNLQNKTARPDWIAISIDSISDDTNYESGRAIVGRKTLSVDYYKELIDLIKEYNVGLKINTVIHRLNVYEDISELIQYAQPERWKIFQVLPIDGQNDGKVEDLLISDLEFEDYIQRHWGLNQITKVVPEFNNQMKGSYVMVDPAGRFFDNTRGKYTYSEPILKIGIERAITQVNYDYNKFINRGGIYNWKK